MAVVSTTEERNPNRRCKGSCLGGGIMARKSKGDVLWYAGSRKRPIAYSTVADSDALSIINFPNRTPNDLMQILNSGRFIAVQEQKRIVQAYIDAGFGNEILKTREI